MSKESSYVVLCMDPVSSRIYFVSEDGRKSTQAPAGAKVRVPTDMKRMTSMSYHEKNVTVEVSTLPITYTIPVTLINALPSGPVELFASSVGFHYQPTAPKETSAAMLLEIQAGGLKAFQLVMGGPAKTATIAFSKLLGLDSRSAGSPDAVFSVSINPTDIQFHVSRSVTDFSPITELFKGSLSHPGLDLEWGDGSGVYVRYKDVTHLKPSGLQKLLY